MESCFSQVWSEIQIVLEYNIEFKYFAKMKSISIAD